VSKSTNFLINNDVESTSGKNQKAKELSIPIISEDEFIARFTLSNTENKDKKEENNEPSFF